MSNPITGVTESLKDDHMVLLESADVPMEGQLAPIENDNDPAEPSPQPSKSLIKEMAFTILSKQITDLSTVMGEDVSVAELYAALVSHVQTLTTEVLPMLKVEKARINRLMNGSTR